MGHGQGHFYLVLGYIEKRFPFNNEYGMTDGMETCYVGRLHIDSLGLHMSLEGSR